MEGAGTVMMMRFRLRAAVLVTALMLWPAIAGNAVAAGLASRMTPDLFGSTSIRSDNLKLFPKWTGALERYFNEDRLANAPCDDRRFNHCQLQHWKAFLKTLRGKDPIDQLRAVNRYANRARYVIDPRNYGVPDYWATPGEFLRRNGDCEDYAIVKFMSLRALGFDPERMRIVVLNDMNLNAAHAVLVVWLGDTALMLDNQVPQVVRADAIRHYRPIYSVNEHHWWLHRYQ